MKRRLFLDLDNTLWSYTKAFCDTYNQIYPNKESLDWMKVRKYNFSCVAPTMTQEEKWNVMGHPLLSKKLKENYYDDVVKIVNEIAEETDVTIVSLCGANTVQRKLEEIKRTFPKVGFIPIIYGTNLKMDKSHINMANGIFLDDRSDMLRQSNADFKIVVDYMDNAVEWNSDWDGKKFTRWRYDIEGKQLKMMLGLQEEENETNC